MATRTRRMNDCCCCRLVSSTSCHHHHHQQHEQPRLQQQQQQQQQQQPKKRIQQQEITTRRRTLFRTTRKTSFLSPFIFLLLFSSSSTIESLSSLLLFLGKSSSSSSSSSLLLSLFGINLVSVLASPPSWPIQKQQQEQHEEEEEDSNHHDVKNGSVTTREQGDSSSTTPFDADHDHYAYDDNNDDDKSGSVIVGNNTNGVQEEQLVLLRRRRRLMSSTTKKQNDDTKNKNKNKKEFKAIIDDSSYAELFEPSDTIRVIAPSEFPIPTRWFEPLGYNLDDISVIVEPIMGYHRSDSDAILAYAEGYGLSYYMMFLETLTSTGYRGDVVFAIAESWYIKADVEDYLRTYTRQEGREDTDNHNDNHDKPNLIVYQTPLYCENNDDPTLGNKRKIMRGGESDVFQFCKLNGIYGIRDPITNDIIEILDDPREARVVATLRYEWYWIWTQRYLPNTWIMLIDARDSYFQSNPFIGLPRQKHLVHDNNIQDGLLYFFGENPVATRLGKSKKNTKWLEKGYGTATLNALSDKPTICSGSTMGEQIALETYLRALINEHDEASVRMTGSDQGFHNYLWYSSKLTNANTIRKIIVWEQGKGIINNLGALRIKSFEEWGFYNPMTHDIYQWDGRTLSPVVHQWDRDKHLHSWMVGQQHKIYVKQYKEEQQQKRQKRQ